MSTVMSKRFNKSYFFKDNKLNLFDDICKKITDEVISLYQYIDEDNKYISEYISNYTCADLISTKQIKFYSSSFYEDIYTFDNRGYVITVLYEINCEINNEGVICISCIAHQFTDKNISEKLKENIIKTLNRYMIDIISNLNQQSVR